MQVLQSFAGTTITPTDIILQEEALVFSLLPERSVKAVMALDPKQKLSSVKKDLESIVSTCAFGRRLYGAAWKAVIAEQIELEVEKAVKSLVEEPKLTLIRFMAIKNDANDAISKITEVDLLPPRRVVKIKYHGWVVEMGVKCASQHVELAMKASLRQQACLKDELTKLPCLATNQPVATAWKDIEIEENLLRKSNAARLFLQQLLAAAEQQNGEALLVSWAFF